MYRAHSGYSYESSWNFIGRSALIIPASTARAFSQTPEQMAVCASVIGGISVAGGLVLSLNFDTHLDHLLLPAPCCCLLSLRRPVA